LALDEAGAGADESDEVGSVDRAPPVLSGFDEFEGHREAGGAAAGPLVTRVRCRTVANVDSMGFEVHR
jgi:hypothetical protein